MLDLSSRTFTRAALAADFVTRWKALHGGHEPTAELRDAYASEWANLLREGFLQEAPSGELPKVAWGAGSTTQPDESKASGERPSASARGPLTDMEMALASAFFSGAQRTAGVNGCGAVEAVAAREYAIHHAARAGDHGGTLRPAGLEDSSMSARQTIISGTRRNG